VWGVWWVGVVGGWLWGVVGVVWGGGVGGGGRVFCGSCESCAAVWIACDGSARARAAAETRGEGRRR